MINKEPIEEEDELLDTETQEAVESLQGYQDYMREVRNESINFGDY